MIMARKKRKEFSSPNRNKIKTAHIELYNRMKFKYDCKTQFTKSDLIDIYVNYVVSRQKTKSIKHNYELTEEQIHANATSWFYDAIPILVRRGYFGLVFKARPGALEMNEEIIDVGYDSTGSYNSIIS